ncbi:MAG: dihydrolipoamide acetyltransferase family protein [Quadrisphaera sp.]
MSRQFLLPDLGEGLTEAEVVRWAVCPGDEVALNQTIAEVETAKAVVELPSPFAGTVERLLVEPGRPTAVGAPIISFTDAAADPGADAAEQEPPAARRTSVLVGYGPQDDDGGSGRRRPRRHRPDATSPGVAAAGAPEVGVPAGKVLAKPPVRLLARQLGVPLQSVHPTGRGGVIPRDDVRAAAAPAGAGRTGGAPPGGRRVPLTGVRRRVAEAMARSASTVPHVTEWVTVDVTRSLKLVEQLRALPDLQGLHVTPLLLVARALVVALRATPVLNATLDEERQEVVLHDAVDLGVAVASPRGLLVPHVPGADRLGLVGLATELTGLVAQARAGESSVAELTGGTVTLTDISGFGVDGGTPILNPGQTAILCAGAVRRQPWEHRGRVRLRSVQTLSLSFDHRVADGLEGSALLRDVAGFLSDPVSLLAR